MMKTMYEVFAVSSRTGKLAMHYFVKPHAEITAQYM